MKNRFFTVLMVIGVTAMILAGCGNTEQAGTTNKTESTSEETVENAEETYVTPPYEADLASYESIISTIPADYYYAFADMDEKNDALLVASPEFCFDNLEGQKTSTEAWVYGFDKDGSIKEYGYVTSGGTAYPLSAKNGKLYYANHTTLWKAYIDEAAGEMIVEETEDFEDYEDVIEVIFVPMGGDVDDEGIDPETAAQAVQDTLTYMGGLYVNHDPENDMELAMFRNEDGDVIYIIYELGNYEYGMYTTEDAKTDDGRNYEKIIVNDDKSYGYYFDEDLTTGILIGEDGKAREAIELDESVARDLVRTTIVGE